VAQHALEQRGAVLAEIESSSGIASPEVASPEIPELSASGVQLMAEEEATTATTQASSLSLETPAKPSVVPRSGPSKWTVGLSAATVVFVAGLALAAWVRRGETSSSPLAAASATTPQATDSAAPQASASAPSPQASDSVASPAATPTAASPPVVRSPPPRAPSSAHAVSPVAPPKPSAAGNCNPDFFLDSNGDKHFKPECFQR
jgi:hypothetical protein